VDEEKGKRRSSYEINTERLSGDRTFYGLRGAFKKREKKGDRRTVAGKLKDWFGL